MGRRTVLLIVAGLIAALGTSMVFMYVRGVDARASEEYDAVQVLKAVEIIAPGETLEQAQAAGKIEMGTVSRAQVLPGATTSTKDVGAKVALATIFPGEQIITGKFGEPGEQKVLTIPDGELAMSVNLSDTGRVAGFVTPGAEVAIFLSAEPTEASGDKEPFTRVLLPRVKVIGVGTTTVISTTTTNAAGAATTEQLPRTLFTLSVDQHDAERIIHAQGSGDLSFGLLTEESKVASGPGVTAANLFD